MHAIRLNSCCLLLLLGMWAPGYCQPAVKTTFTNPLVTSGPDPWMYRHTDGYYYFMATAGNRLDLWKSRTITGIAQATPQTIWTKPAAGPNSEAIWAPEIHFLDGKWYIYYTATDAAKNGDHNRFVFVLENPSPDPTAGTWTDKGRVNTKYTGLDGSVFAHGGKRYFVYSAYVGPQSRLFIAPMRNPWTIEGPEVEIARPTYPWEKHQDREILEGPQFLPGKNGDVFIIYSASACWDDNYALGMLTASGKSDLLAAASWRKSASPVFRKSPENSVYGPGHNSFTQSPDGKEDWIVYHAKTVADGKCAGRSTRVQKFTWNADGTPNFGVPVPAGVAVQKPSGE